MYQCEWNIGGALNICEERESTGGQKREPASHAGSVLIKFSHGKLAGGNDIPRHFIIGRKWKPFFHIIY